LQRLKKCIWCFLRAGLSLIVLEVLSLFFSFNLCDQRCEGAEIGPIILNSA
jgi:hypothetical protein